MPAATISTQCPALIATGISRAWLVVRLARTTALMARAPARACANERICAPMKSVSTPPTGNVGAATVGATPASARGAVLGAATGAVAVVVVVVVAVTTASGSAAAGR